MVTQILWQKDCIGLFPLIQWKMVNMIKFGSLEEKKKAINVKAGDSRYFYMIRRLLWMFSELCRQSLPIRSQIKSFMNEIATGYGTDENGIHFRQGNPIQGFLL